MREGGNRQVLRVFIGPVQGFIASGRRTRDFWAGSFLLSWLSGVAMNEVIDAGGSITIPVVFGEDGKTVSEPTLQAIRQATTADFGGGIQRGPLVGTLVNHFRAEVPENFKVSSIKTAVRAKFKELADQVFDVFIKPILADSDANNVEERWEDQTSGAYFEVLAVMGEAPDWSEESVWLERRKMLRTHAPLLAQAGADRCPVHGDLAELGGFSQQYQRDQQDEFWKKLRYVVGTRMYEEGGAGAEPWTDNRAAQMRADQERESEGDPGVGWSAGGRKFRDTLEIRENEHLSGLALVKRLFPLLEPRRIAKVIGWMPDHIYDVRTPSQKWNPQEARYALRNWPSTAFIAAIPWIVKVGGAYAYDTKKNYYKDAARKYAENQYNTLGANPIWEAERPQYHRVKGVDDLDRKSVNGKTVLPKFAILDGTLHFERGLEKRRFDGRNNAAQIASKLQNEFKKLIKIVRANPADLQDGPASTHYAMLDMDGDGMGAVFSHSLERAKRGSKALLAFSAAVPEIIRNHDGILIYAGADDVNAMLPIETAIPCARAVNTLWTKTIQNQFVTDEDPCDTPTLSGSIVFVDYQNALDDVRRLTHERLDKVAKEGMGRNALALAVMKSGGIVSEWASCWHDADCRDTAGGLFDYARAAGKDKTIASRLPYLIRERFGEIMVGHSRDDGTDLFDDTALAAFLKKEMSDSVLSGFGDSDTEKAQKIVDVLRPYYRRRGTRDIVNAPRHVGGLLVARFLAQNCMWSYFEDWKARSGGSS